MEKKDLTLIGFYKGIAAYACGGGGACFDFCGRWYYRPNTTPKQAAGFIWLCWLSNYDDVNVLGEKISAPRE